MNRIPYITLRTRLAALLFGVGVGALAGIFVQLWLGHNRLLAAGVELVVMVSSTLCLFMWVRSSSADFVSREESQRRSRVEALALRPWQLALPPGCGFVLMTSVAWLNPTDDLPDQVAPAVIYCFMGLVFGFLLAWEQRESARRAAAEG